eukprot:1382973-Prorocentrum_lima.AAC.1
MGVCLHVHPCVSRAGPCVDIDLPFVSMRRRNEPRFRGAAKVAEDLLVQGLAPCGMSRDLVPAN